MPIIQIHMLPGRTDEEKRAVLTAIHEAVTSTLGVPDSAVRAWITDMDPARSSAAARSSPTSSPRPSSRYSQSSISLRAIDRRPGSSGRSSRVNQRASTSSASSMRQVAAHPVRGEADHERVRERPRLAREVGDPVDLDADLLLELAGDALLERLAGLDEARQHAVHPAGKALRARQQDLVAAGHAHDHRRREARERSVPADGAASRALAGRVLGGRAAAAAVDVRAIPLDELRGAARQRPEMLVDAAVEVAQRAERHARRRLVILGQLGGAAGDAVELAEVERAYGRHAESRNGGRRRQLVVVAAIQHEHVHALDAEPEGVAFDRRCEAGNEPRAHVRRARDP